MQTNNFKIKHIIIIIFASVLINIYSCEKEKSPSCTIVHPQNGQEFGQGDTINISVEANDPDGSIAEVKFYRDGIGKLPLYSPPYNYNFLITLDEIDIHTIIISATAKDDQGNSSSDEISIYINGGGETGTVTDFDGNTYHTIKIGKQWWMAENIKSTHYNDGTEIQLVESSSSWGNLEVTDKAMCYTPNSGSIVSALYTWAAAVNDTIGSTSSPSNVQGVCPDGWHLPSDDEWKQLEIYLGMPEADANDEGKKRGTYEGSKLAGNSEIWQNGELKQNILFDKSDFEAIPGGQRYEEGDYYYLYGGILPVNTSWGYVASFWSATDRHPSYSWIRSLSYESTKIRRFENIKTCGCSVRCIRDE